MSPIKMFSVAKISLIIYAVTLSSLNAHAALYDRGNGMIYDSSLNITWLQDANYSQTSGYDADGLMTWTESNTWADNLVYGGFSDWRLASAKLNGSGSTGESGYYSGADDYGYNNTRSEIGHLFLELGNKAYFNTAGVAQSGYGVTNTTFADGATNQSVSFLNIKAYAYWEAETYASIPPGAWLFGTNYGLQGNFNNSSNYYAWAVRDGDVSSDVDNDGILDSSDNCPSISNIDQTNTDGDSQGNACDSDEALPMSKRQQHCHCTNLS